ncbi:MAG: DUF2236 domain-containing protein [Actinobacteria bacterium]|nr:DUF2236 domain-containing protein [Actinomycetota bacterium]
MAELHTRRSVLKKGGVASAFAAFGGLGIAGLTGCEPQASGPGINGWTWSPTGSIPGTGTGADPTWVWDPQADDLVASLLDRGLVEDVNTKLAGWLYNGQALPAGLPADVVAFIESARQLPSWTDRTKLAKGASFNQKQGWAIGTAYGFASGMMSTVIPHEARAVYYSKGGADMRDRITKTAKLGYDIGLPGAFDPTGHMIVTCVKTRLAHAGVRNLLPSSAGWGSTADQTMPISQRDMLVTWASLPTTVAATLGKWNVPATDSESQGYLHTWQVTAHLLGIRDEYIPGSWAAAKTQSDQLLTPVLGPSQEGIELADTLLHLLADLDSGVLTYPAMCGLARYVLGDQIANWLEIPRQWFWDPTFATYWPPFIAFRSGTAAYFPGTAAVYAVFDEIVKLGALIYLSGGQFPISIKIPTINNPNEP